MIFVKRLASAVCIASVVAFAGVNSANATFVIDNVNASDSVDFTKAKNQATFFGTVLSPDDVSFSATGNVDVANGNATIKPIKNGTLTSLTIAPVNSLLFDGFSFRGQLEKAGTITLTVQDAQGDAPQTFHFAVSNANKDFSAFGISGLPTDETIKSIIISDSDGFKSLKQFAFDEVAPVPEPSTWAMMIVGFMGLGFVAYRKRRADDRQGGLSFFC
jgi:PEP-CTERM motif